jgi:hypothetical protein
MQASDCLFAEVTLMFCAVHIHSITGDPTRGIPRTDTVTVLPTGRNQAAARRAAHLADCARRAAELGAAERESCRATKAIDERLKEQR